MHIEIGQRSICIEGCVTIRWGTSEIELVFAPETTTAPDFPPAREVDVIYQCGNSEFVFVER